ncbi:MAG: hypothetical protein AAGF15_11550, partial [Pseudomonadota bacterium]
IMSLISSPLSSSAFVGVAQTQSADAKQRGDRSADGFRVGRVDGSSAATTRARQAQTDDRQPVSRDLSSARNAKEASKANAPSSSFRREVPGTTASTIDPAKAPPAFTRPGQLLDISV